MADGEVTTLETFSPELADCEVCSLREACAARKFATSFVGPKYKRGGLMVVGEMPTRRDIQQGIAFSGREGELLRGILGDELAHIDPATVWFTNALLTEQPGLRGAKNDANKKAALAQYAKNLYACQPRLVAEIEYAQPRVIVTLGQGALDALTSREEQKVRLIDVPCEHCDPVDRKIGPFMVCAGSVHSEDETVVGCKHRTPLPDVTLWFEKRRAHLSALLEAYDEGVIMNDAHREDPERMARQHALDAHVAQANDPTKCWRAWWLEQNAGVCPTCKSSMRKIRPKRIACDVCGGKKKRQEIETLFVREYTLTGREGAVGAVIAAPGFADLGVKYIIPTYAMDALLVPARDGAKGGKTGGTLQFGQYAARPCVDHFSKARRLLTRDAVFNVDVITTEGMSSEEAAELVRDYTAEPGTYTVDIETDSMDGAWKVTCITCIGINRIDWDDALVVDTRWIGGRWHEGDPLYEALGDFLADEAKKKVLHNAPYDRVVMLRLWGFVTEGVEADTMLAHNACYPDEEHNLGFCAHELTDAPMWKGGGVTKQKFDEHKLLSGYRTFPDLALYNARDLRATSKVRDALLGYNGKAHGRVDFEKVREVFNTDMRMQAYCIDMEVNGMPLNRKHLQLVDEGKSKDVALLLSDMRQFVGECPPEILGKNEQWRPTGKMLQWALYDPTGPLGLPVLKSTTKGGSTDKDTLQQHISVPFVRTLVQYNKEEYVLAHYVRSSELETAEDGRLHPQWKCHGARTGRFTSYPNMQNWPRWMRQAFTAPKGRKLVGADQSQLEMRIMAALSGDAEMIHRCATANEKDKLNPEADPHSYMASKTFGAAFTDKNMADPLHYKAAPGQRACKCETCQRSMLREIVKRVVYGLNYGAGAQTVLDAIYDAGYDGPALDVREIERVTAVYFRTFPGVPIWRNNTYNAALRDREIRSPLLGRHRIFPLGSVDPSVVYNYPIQSGGADIMALGLMRLMPDLAAVDPTAVLIAQIHDAIYFECDEDRAHAVGELITERMSAEHVLAPGAPAMPFVMKAKIGDDLFVLS
jgi:uracil-DNA glycosylase family 4